MGKHAKNKSYETLQNQQRGNVANEEDNVGMKQQANSAAKASKRQKKRIKKQRKLKDCADKNQPNMQQQKQKNTQRQRIVKIGQTQNDDSSYILSEHESVIEISSQHSQFSKEKNVNSMSPQLNQKEKQGFENLIMQTNQYNKNKVNELEFKRKMTNQKQQVHHLFHVKKNSYYKVASQSHQRVNLTHLNQTISLHIIPESLLKSDTTSQPISFYSNGEFISSELQFIKSTVFKLTEVKQQSSKQECKAQKKSKKQKTLKSIDINEKLKQNIISFIRPSSSEQLQLIIEFLRDFQWKEDGLLISRQNLLFRQTEQPFKNIDQSMFKQNNSTLILGKKNSGKSTLAQFIRNTHYNDVCILDCDIGRSLTIAGCVSLLTQEQAINLWVGEFTPFNCITGYLRAIQVLYLIYREKYFTKKLIINTMGYLSGLGQFILYEIYNLINPSEILVLNYQSETNSFSADGNLSTIIYNLKSGNYLKKLLTKNDEVFVEAQLKKFNQKRVALTVLNIRNDHAQSKGVPVRFQNLICYKKCIKNIVQLIKMIKRGELQKIENIAFYEQDKLGNTTKLNADESYRANMRIVLLGKSFSVSTNESSHYKMVEPDGLFRVFGVGFGFQGKIYFSKAKIKQNLSAEIKQFSDPQTLIGLLGEGIDFQKNFYLVHELSLIDLQLQFGVIGYMLPIVKGIGSKGVRNNPGKNS